MDKKVVNALSAMAILAVPPGFSPAFDSASARDYFEDITSIPVRGFSLYSTDLQ